MSALDTVDIWYPTYIGEFFTLSAAMSGHEVGAYHLIIAQLWKSGGAIPADEKQLARLTKSTPKEWRQIKQALWPLFTINAGVLSHTPTTDEIAKAKKNREQRRLAGIASGASRKRSTASETATINERPFNGCSTGVATDAERERQRKGNEPPNETSTKREPRAGSGEGEGPSEGSPTSKERADTREASNPETDW